MNLEDVIDPEYGLQQDEYSQSGVTFGEQGQLKVIGWSGKSSSNKYYILRCEVCSKDPELFGDGVFRTPKGCLLRRKVPCGCGFSPRWSEDQYKIKCRRKAEELGYEFLGWSERFNGRGTKVTMLCGRHGEWNTSSATSLLTYEVGCPECGNEKTGQSKLKPDDIMVSSFFKSGCFHPDTKFWRSERKCRRGRKPYWFMSCPECGERGESDSSSLQQGNRPCACSKQRQQEAYVNWVVDDHNNAVAIKFGIAVNSQRRAEQQNSKSIYEIRNYLVYEFPTVEMCKKAERLCKRKLECGVIPKTDMPDGYTETTSVLNLAKVKKIFDECGGVEIENNA